MLFCYPQAACSHTRLQPRTALQLGQDRRAGRQGTRAPHAVLSLAAGPGAPGPRSAACTSLWLARETSEWAAPPELGCGGCSGGPAGGPGASQAWRLLEPSARQSTQAVFLVGRLWGSY